MTTSGTDRPFAVVTGASSGIGYELAVQFVEHGYDLLIAAEDDGIGTVAERLRRDGGPRVDPVRTDLTRAEGVEELAAAVAGRPVDALALNAGRGAGGEFVGGTTLADELAVVDLNVRSTVHLAKLLLPDMVRRGAGRVLFTSSISATLPGPFQAVYDASKSFVQSFAEALRDELKDTGVTVTSLMPGPTDTEFFDRAEMADTRVASGRKDDPRTVAEQGFAAMLRGDQTVTAGSLLTKVQTAAGKILPDKLNAAQHRRMAEPGSGN
ncbi:SDR family NAD(P)-dependent oxidoreductase [Micromonospora sp. WMMD737]|uniref:SDR family NAD(P)-dependent oxidoreductase n=1 Tax=Micromonospora sp. WMMD737 TaxID=3404113 RepID=UPI003B94EC90